MPATKAEQGGGRGGGGTVSSQAAVNTLQDGRVTPLEEEVQRLQSRVDVLEQKLLLLLAPLYRLASRALEHRLPDSSSFWLAPSGSWTAWTLLVSRSLS
uniref:Uncharacterized protein n=1 Tax=Suricata suricatta TaxID=37032 RepID=A0A673TQ84_SURSU